MKYLTFLILNLSFFLTETSYSKSYNHYLYNKVFGYLPRSDIFDSDSAYGDAQKFKTTDKKIKCQYPARYYYLSKLDLLPNNDFSECIDLNDFLERAPIQSLSLMYASESITQPASMVGHSFLKISGNNRKDQNLDHALSFFTRMNDVDPFTLLIQSFITGKQGFYSLSPLSETIDYYINTEGRSIWEYQIELNAEELYFTRLLLYELKNVKFKYFFHAFNCATFIDHILRMIFDDFETNNILWKTPLDLVRYVNENKLVKTRELHSGPDWILRKFHASNKYYDIKNIIEKETMNLEETVYLQNYNIYLFNKKQIDSNRYQKNSEKLTSIQNQLDSNYKITVFNKNSPETAIQDSQIRFSYKNNNFGNYLSLYFLPLSHFVENNLQHLSYESEVILLGLGVESDIVKKDGLKFSELEIFKISSYQFHDRILGGYSGQLNISVLNDYYNLNMIHKIRIDSGVNVGKTFRLLNDIDFYFWPGFLVQASDSTHIYFDLKSGLIVRKIFNSKSIISFEHSQNYKNEYFNYFALSESISWSNYNFGFKLNHSKNFQNISNSESSLYFSILF